jgi:magnesium transporter
MPKEDLIHEKSFELLRERLPWLLLGLIGALAAASLVRTFEEVLQKNLMIAFFIPSVVYMADAVGTQTETIFIRGMAQESFSKTKYLSKEILVGALIGILLGVAAALLITLWFGNFTTGIIVGLSMFFSIIAAVIINTLIPLLFVKLKVDPALGSGPFATVVQDLVTLFVYFKVASLVM